MNLITSVVYKYGGFQTLLSFNSDATTQNYSKFTKRQTSCIRNETRSTCRSMTNLLRYTVADVTATESNAAPQEGGLKKSDPQISLLDQLAKGNQVATKFKPLKPQRLPRVVEATTP